MDSSTLSPSDKSHGSEESAWWCVVRRDRDLDSLAGLFKINHDEVPVFFSLRLAEIFIQQNMLPKESWTPQAFGIPYIQALIMLTERMTWRVMIFYSYDAKHESWGTKRTTISMKDHYLTSKQTLHDPTS